MLIRFTLATNAVSKEFSVGLPRIAHTGSGNDTSKHQTITHITHKNEHTHFLENTHTI